MLNLLTSTAIERLRQINGRMWSGSEVASYLPPERSGGASVSLAGAFFAVRYDDGRSPEGQTADERAEWARTTHPTDLYYVGVHGLQDAAPLAGFEASRRATIWILEIQAYRLEHHRLPDSLQLLSLSDSAWCDPYSGKPFRYFPKGVPQEPKEHWMTSEPCIWSPSAELSTDPYSDNAYYRRQPWGSTASARRLIFAEAWDNGYWYPIKNPE